MTSQETADQNQPSTPAPAPVSVIGLGPMGSALAEAYLRQGHPTTVWNRSPGKDDALVAQGARRAESVAEAVSASPLLVVCVKDYDALYAIFEPVGADPSGPDLAGRVLVNLSSGTPQQTHEAVAWARERGADYLDGVVMVPPPAVGDPDSVFLYSGSQDVFDSRRDTLATLGKATYLGTDPSLAVVYNTALLGLMYATLNGFLHATALVGTIGVPAEKFAELAAEWFLPSVVTADLGVHAREIDRRNYPGELGPMEMNLTAIEHLLHTSREQGVDTELPRHMKELVERAIAEGYRDNNYMAVVEVLRKPSGDSPER